LCCFFLSAGADLLQLLPTNEKRARTENTQKRKSVCTSSEKKNAKIPTNKKKKKMGWSELPIESSAPGKIILFGEHAVVLGKTAVASALGLRTTSKFEAGSAGKLETDFVDLKAHQTWNLSDIDAFQSPLLAKVDGERDAMNDNCFFAPFQAFTKY
jgi:hypothetical protein